MVAEGASLGGAPTRARNRIPVGGQLGLARATGSRVRVDNGPNISQARQGDQTPAGGSEWDVGNERAHEMRGGAVVGRDR